MPIFFALFFQLGRRHGALAREICRGVHLECTPTPACREQSSVRRLLPPKFLHSYLCEVSAKKLGMSHLSDSSLRGVRRSSFTESAPLPHRFLTFGAKCVFSHSARGVCAPAADFYFGGGWDTKFHQRWCWNAVVQTHARSFLQKVAKLFPRRLWRGLGDAKCGQTSPK